MSCWLAHHVASNSACMGAAAPSGAPPPARPQYAGLAEVQRILPSGIYSIRLEQGRANCEFRGELQGCHQLERTRRLSSAASSHLGPPAARS